MTLNSEIISKFNSKQDNIGVGIGFPFQFVGGRVMTTAYDKDNPPDFTTGERVDNKNPSKNVQINHMKQDIAQVVGVSKGERFYRTPFGANFESLVFEPLDENLVNIINYFVNSEVTNTDRRVGFVRSSVVINKENNGMQTKVTYEILSDNIPGNKVFPYYIERNR